MAEPTSGIAIGTAAGLGALFVATVGVEPQALVWGFVGATFGVPMAPPSGRVRSIMVFFAVILACALLGTWAADYWFQGGRMARNGFSMGLGAVFHPLFARVVMVIPAIVDSVVRARTGGQQ